MEPNTNPIPNESQLDQQSGPVAPMQAGVATPSPALDGSSQARTSLAQDPWARLALGASLTPLIILFLLSVAVTILVMIGLIGWVVLALFSGPAMFVVLGCLYFIGHTWVIKKLGFSNINTIVISGTVVFLLTLGYYVYLQDIQILKLLASLSPLGIGDEGKTTAGVEPILVASMLSALAVLISARITNKNLR